MGSAEKASERLWRSQGAHITDSVDTYYFAAYGVETVSEYQYNISLRNSLEEKVTTSIGGDGTVLIVSSGLDYRYADRTFYSEKTTHAGSDSANGLDGILDATKIWTMIQRIIDEEELSTNLPKGISRTPPEMYI